MDHPALKVLEVLALWSGLSLLLGFGLAAALRHVKQMGRHVARMEKRGARRYGLSLPVAIHAGGGNTFAWETGRTRDISARGVYFLTESNLSAGREVSLTITIPAEITKAADVFLKIMGKVVRVKNSVEYDSSKIGVAVTIDRYELVPGRIAASPRNSEMPMASGGFGSR